MKSLIKSMVLFWGLAGSVYAEDMAQLQAVSLDQATLQVANIDNNTILQANTEKIDDKEIHIIKVLEDDGLIKFYEVDAKTGLLISQEP
jgi:hypothetical protein